MLAYVFLFIVLTGTLGVSEKCPVKELIDKINYEDLNKTIPENCLCNSTSGSHDDTNLTECKCFKVPLDENNCNLTCFQTGIKKYPKISRDFKKRVSRCKESSHCQSPCHEMENVTAETFWNRLLKALKNINNQL